jgi:hypothetical protein
MIPVGYMYKSVSVKPDWLKAEQVADIYSVSGCISKDFHEWINYWKHNGYWLFNQPSDIQKLVKENFLSLDGMKLFYYKSYEKQWDNHREEWVSYEPEISFETNVKEPVKFVLEGYDIVSFFCQTSAECSPLSCNHMAHEIKVNSHCLLNSFEDAKKLLESDTFINCEPGPYRIFEVYSVEYF